MMMTTTKKRIWKNNILSYVPPKISFVKSLPGETKDQEKKMVSIDQSNIRERKRTTQNTISVRPDTIP
jgi:hypothetical protein